MWLTKGITVDQTLLKFKNHPRTVYMGVDLLPALCLHDAKLFVKLKIELSFARERRQLGESKKQTPFMSPAAALSILGGAKKMNVN